MLAEETGTVLSFFHTTLGMIFLWVYCIVCCVRINCERETPVTDWMHSFYFNDQIGAGWFITDTTQAANAQTNREHMMSWPQGQWIKYGDANGANPMGQQECQVFVSSSLRLALMETNQPHQKLPQPVQTEIFGVCSLYIRLLLMVKLVMTSLIP